MIDLHIHSTFSDGSDDVKTLIEKVKNSSVKFFSITDHDTAQSARTILSDKTLQNKIRENNLSYVVGTEWTCGFMGLGMHILAYDFDPFAPEVLELEKEIKDILKEKTAFRLNYIEEKGYVFSKNSQEFLNTRINVKKPNIARCLVNDGYFDSFQDAIDFLNEIKYPKKYRLDGEKVLKTLSSIGAKMVWAHSIHGQGKSPLSYDEIEKYCTKMKEFGLIGLECYYSLYNSEEIENLLKIAKKLNLFVTAGSDYHGENRNVKIGETSSDGTIQDEKNINIFEIFSKIIE